MFEQLLQFDPVGPPPNLIEFVGDNLKHHDVVTIDIIAVGPKTFRGRANESGYAAKLTRKFHPYQIEVCGRKLSICVVVNREK